MSDRRRGECIIRAAMQVFVAGSTGYIGRAVVAALVRRGHSVKALVRRGSEVRAPRGAGVEIVQGDLLRPYTYETDVIRCDAAVNCAGILRERPGVRATYDRVHVDAVRHLLDALRAAKVPRIVHLSALGVRPDSPAAYHRTKLVGEEEVRQ